MSFSSLNGLVTNPALCSDIASSCLLGNNAGATCLNAYPSTSQRAPFLACLCQEPLLSMASVCEYDGNITCLGLPAARSNIDVWRNCPRGRAKAEASSFYAAQLDATSSAAPGMMGPSSVFASTTASSALPGPTTSGSQVAASSGTAPADNGGKRTQDGQAVVQWLVFVLSIAISMASMP